MTSLHSLWSLAQTQTYCCPAELRKCVCLVILSLALLSEKLSPKHISFLKVLLMGSVVTGVKVGVLAAPAGIPPWASDAKAPPFFLFPSAQIQRVLESQRTGETCR